MQKVCSVLILGLVAAALTIFGPTTLVAQDLGYGAELSLMLARNTGKSDNFKRIAASFSTGRLRWVGLQLDLSVSKYEETYSTSPSAGAHVYRRFGPDTAVGLFVAGDDLRPGNYFYAGLEAKHQAGPLVMEGYIAHLDVIKSDRTGIRWGLDVDYGLRDRPGRGFDAVTAGYHAASLPGADHSYAYLGARYAFGRGVSLEATAGRNDEGDTIIAAMLRFAIGDGTTFRRRGWNASLPAH